MLLDSFIISLQLYLQSMCKYLPRVTVTHLFSGVSKTFSYPETNFVAVTAYQNPQVGGGMDGGRCVGVI